MSDSETTTVTIGKNVHVKLASPLVVPGDIELHGEIEGDIQCTSIYVGPTGRVNGSVSAEHVEVQGQIAKQTSTATIVLREGSYAAGSIEYDTVTIEAGAQIDAQLTKRSNEAEGSEHVASEESYSDVASQ